MRSFKTLRTTFLSKSLSWSISLLMGFGFVLSLETVIRAESPESAPAELKNAIAQMEAAANQRNLEQLMQFYSPEFTNSDGLTYETLNQALTQLWERYGTLQYTTELQSWEQVEDELVAETLTQIQGTSNEGGREMKLNATIKSRQYFQGQKLVRQEILTERTDITAGTNPPQVDVMLPEKVSVGEEFDFDVIVKEPLGDGLLVGTAIEEKIEADRYLNPGALELEVLQAGGIFKRAKAPETPENHWISAILIRGDGIVLVTQRLRVEQ